MASPPNDLTETFSSILYNISDYEKQLTDIAKIFTKTMDEIDKLFFMSIDFLEYYKDYPRYPIDFKVIQNLSKYNLVTIYNIVQNDVKYLLNAIETPEVLALKNSYDKIPNVEIQRDYNLQTTYFTNISSSLFNRDIYNGFSLDKTRQSYLFKTFGYYIPQEMKESSLISNYILYVFLLRNLRSSLKIFESTFSSKAYLLRKNTIYINSFNQYLDGVKKKFAESLIKYILEYTYKISDPSRTFLNEIINRVTDKLDGLKDLFANAMSIKDSITNNMILTGTEILYNYIACKFTNSAADPTLNLVNNDLVTSLKSYELEVYNKITDKYSIQSFREYLYLVYYYKLYPRKFLNVLQLAIISYVRQNLVDQNESIFNYAVLLSYFYKLLGSVNTPASGGINFSNLQELLSQVITPTYLIETIEQQKIVEFTTRMGMVNYFEDVFSLDDSDFDKFIDELYEIIFSYLKESVQIEPYYEYYFNKKMIFWYVLSYLKRDIFQNKIFNKEEIQISEVFDEIINSPSYKVNFNIERMRSRTVQYVEGNINNIGNLFDNIVETAAEKKLHSENITYFFN